MWAITHFQLWIDCKLCTRLVISYTLFSNLPLDGVPLFKLASSPWPKKNRMFCSNEIAVIGNVKLVVFQLPFCKKKTPQRILFDCEELPQIRLMFISLNLKISSHSFKTKSNNGVGNISLKGSFLKSLAFGLAANIQNLKVVSSGELR